MQGHKQIHPSNSQQDPASGNRWGAHVDQLGICQCYQTSELPGEVYQTISCINHAPMCQVLSQLQGKP